MPATRASATVAASCRLPKRSTQVTSVRRQARPSCRRPSSTTPPTRRTSEAGCTGVPRSSSAAPVHNAAAAGPKRSRPSNVEPRSGGAGRAGQFHHVCHRRLGRRLRRGHEQPVVGPDEPQRRAGGLGDLQSDAASIGADARIDDAEHHSGPEVRHRPHQGVTPRPDVERRHVMGQVDDGRPGCTRRNDRVHHAGELVLGAEVGEEEDGAGGFSRHGWALSAAGCAIARWRLRPPP